ncbi:MAG: D-alanyl-D-alanine carboxypeptidase family protein [Lachnospirales bacterium]
MLKIKKISTFLIILLYTISSNISTVLAKDTLYNSDDLKFDLESHNISVIDSATGIILYGKNPNEIVYPASTTKIMTALLLLEATSDVDTERIEFTYDAVSNLEYDAAIIGMNVGDSLSVRDALYGLLLASANEVANAIAIHLSGSIEQFGIDMTSRAKALGCEKTNFTNPSGLHDPNHYTTAFDMATILAEVSKYEVYREISSTAMYEIQPTETYEEVRTVYNTNLLINQNSSYYNENVIASKTGYTSKAGYNLVTIATDNDKNEYLIATLNSTNKGRFVDTNNIVDFFNGKYNHANLSNIITVIEPITIPSNDENFPITLYRNIPFEKSEINLPINADVIENYTYTTNMDNGNTSVDIYYNDIKVANANTPSDAYIVDNPYVIPLNSTYPFELPKPNKIFSLSHIIGISLTIILAIIIFFIFKIKFLPKYRKRRFEKQFGTVPFDF